MAEKIIDTAALIDSLRILLWDRSKTREELAELVIGLIDEAGQEIVRCEDCAHWHESTGWCNKHSYFVDDEGMPCDPSESPNWKMFDANDFCSYGERRDSDDRIG